LIDETWPEAMTPPETNGRAPEAPDDRPELAAAAVDHTDLADKLRQDRKNYPAALVEFMANRQSAKFDDIKRHVHGDDDVSDEAVRKNVYKTRQALIELNSPLDFSTSGGYVFKALRYPSVTPR